VEIWCLHWQSNSEVTALPRSCGAIGWLGCLWGGFGGEAESFGAVGRGSSLHGGRDVRCGLPASGWRLCASVLFPIDQC
jgi:hypothetical protein